MKYEDLAGEIFGRLKVIKRTDDKCYPSGRHDIQYECQCSCGTKVTVLGIHLRSGHTKSCGCLRREISGINMSTHGGADTRLYNIWRNMRRRCLNERHKNYPLYGGRGIAVCEEWVGDYSAFKAWAIENGYTDSLTLDRMDVNGDYCPSNCRWVTQKEQCNNTRRNIIISFDGQRHTLKEWATITGVNYRTLYGRVKRGWPYERAFAI